MICRKCGKQIEGNRLFCPVCGTEVQMVPEYGRVDDELQKNMSYLKEEAGKAEKDSKKDVVIPGAESLQIPVQPVKKQRTENRRNIEDTRSDSLYSQEYYEEEELEDDWEEFSLEKKVTAGQKRTRLIIGITALSIAIIALLIGIVCFAVFSANKSSYSKQMEDGSNYWKNGDYESAITAFENALEQSENSNEKADALSNLAEIYIEYGDDNSAIYYYEELAAIQQLSNEDVTTLVGLYENKSDITAIRKLAETYNNKDTETLFEKHLLNQPVFNYKSGTYNELLTVEITSANGESIFYTLDNTPATAQSTPYTGVLQIGEGTTVVRAITVNEKGMVSDEIITTYEVKLDVPPAPIITPETGSYAETMKIGFQNIPTNCKAYYTIDGTVPTAESIEYKEPFDMMLGNYVIMAVCINQYTGQSSSVSMKIYDLSVNGKISYAEAPGRVMNRLIELGEVLDGDGSMSNGEVCTLLPVTVRKIGNTDYYIVKRYQTTQSGMKEHGDAYAVDINTGAVFKAEDNGNGEFNLSGL